MVGQIKKMIGINLQIWTIESYIFHNSIKEKYLIFQAKKVMHIDKNI